MERRALRWIDIDRLGQELFREYPTLDPEKISDGDLQARIITLKNFNDSPYPPNAMYLDLIRDAWDDALTATTKITDNAAGSTNTA